MPCCGADSMRSKMLYLTVLLTLLLLLDTTTSARLRSIATYSGRKETAVYATDVRTGVVIRCKVFIDNFSRIQIFHNSIKLDLDGLATLRVRAFDSEGGFNFEINFSYLVR